MFCIKCGTKLPDDALFCPQCGNRITTYQKESSENINDCSYNYDENDNEKMNDKKEKGYAFDLCLNAAEQGDAEAQFEVAFRYFTYGEYEQAVKWLRRAAENGNIEAQCHLGQCYYEGVGYGIEKDYEQAVKWLRKAAEQGSHYAECYMKNRGLQ
ncbi:MAG: SEL1-like repeat protein [Phascolarctobacterium sp.]|nr:SEL1-like repeat protein [Candidatus Phascolarctobacterium caballi]